MEIYTKTDGERHWKPTCLAHLLFGQVCVSLRLSSEVFKVVSAIHIFRTDEWSCLGRRKDQERSSYHGCRFVVVPKCQMVHFTLPQCHSTLGFSMISIPPFVEINSSRFHWFQKKTIAGTPYVWGKNGEHWSFIFHWNQPISSSVDYICIPIMSK